MHDSKPVGRECQLAGKRARQAVVRSLVQVLCGLRLKPLREADTGADIANL